MTREEAIEILTGVNIVDTTAYLEALGVAAAALIESARQAPAKLDRSRWKRCPACPPPLSVWWYCPFCGRPRIETAWAELERKIGGNDGTTD